MATLQSTIAQKRKWADPQTTHTEDLILTEEQSLMAVQTMLRVSVGGLARRADMTHHIVLGR